jgi:hypothetical protein
MSELDLALALRLLGQDPEDDLKCVYCGLRADTWDHLIGLVKNAELRGYGHQLGNLVPCCRVCNSKKGAKDWDVHLREILPDPSAFDAKYALLVLYRDRYAFPVNLEQAAELLPEEWARYCQIKQEIFRLMAEADKIATRLRTVVASGKS